MKTPIPLHRAIRLLFVTALTLAAVLSSAQEPRLFPAELVDIDGQRIDITELAANDHLVVVTLKATWCPVCQQQLLRLKELLPEHPEWKDAEPFKTVLSDDPKAVASIGKEGFEKILMAT